LHVLRLSLPYKKEEQKPQRQTKLTMSNTTTKSLSDRFENREKEESGKKLGQQSSEL
jgi:hypothetical protein